MKRQAILALPIPVVFALGIFLFFFLVPRDVLTLPNFISYLASLSTVAMVLVYFLTASQQLKAMSNQLKEMEFSRNVAVQPLLNFASQKLSMEAPRYYVGSETGLEKLYFHGRVNFCLDVTNIGNGPIVAANFFPIIGNLSSKKEKIEPFMKPDFESRIECISLEKNNSRSLFFLFQDESQKFLDSVLSFDLIVYLTVVFKNVLGMPFKEKIAFHLDNYDTKLIENLKSFMKASKTAETDYSDKVKRFDELKRLGRDKDADKIQDELNSKIKNQLGGIEILQIPVSIQNGSLYISPITNEEYEKIINEGQKS